MTGQIGRPGGGSAVENVPSVPYHAIMRLLRLAIAVCFAAAPALAQTGSATVEGAVTDPAGAVVPNADVTLTHLETSVAQRTKTNGAGLYIFPPRRSDHISSRSRPAGWRPGKGESCCRRGSPP